MIDWKSRKQKCVTKASTYAEYVALLETVSEVKFIKELINIFGLKLSNPVKIYEDNTRKEVRWYGGAARQLPGRCNLQDKRRCVRHAVACVSLCVLLSRIAL